MTSSAATLTGDASTRDVRHGLVRSTLLVVGSSAIAQGMLVAASPLLTRLYSPAQFGLLGTYAAIAGLLVVLAGLRFDAAIPLPKDDDDATRLLALALASGLLTAALTALVVGTAGTAIANALAVPELGPWLWFLPIAVIGGSAYQAFSFWHIRNSGFTTIARTKLTQSSAALGVQVALGGLAGPAGLFLGDLASRGAGTISLGRHALAGANSQALSWAQCLTVAGTYRRFPLVSSWSAVANVGALIALPPLFAVLYGTSSAGAVVVAQRMVDLPVALVGAAAGQVFFGRTASAVRDDPSQAVAIFRVAVWRLAPCAALLAVACAVAAPMAFGPILGPRWGEAGEFAQILGVAAACRLVVSPVSTLVWMAGKQWLQMCGDVLRLVTVIGAVVAAQLAWPGSPRAAVGCYAGAMVTSYTGFFFLYRYCASHIARTGRAEGEGGMA